LSDQERMLNMRKKIEHNVVMNVKILIDHGKWEDIVKRWKSKLRALCARVRPSIYIYILHTDFIGNSVKLRNQHNFYLRVPENRAVTAIWKKPMRIFSDALSSGGSILFWEFVEL